MKSLKVTIYIQIIVLIVVTNILTGMASFLASTREIDSHLREEAEQVSKRIARSLAFPYWNLDSMGVSEIVDAQMRGSNMYAITLNERSEVKHFIPGLLKNSGGEISLLPRKHSVSSPFKSTAEILFEGEKLGTVTVMVTDDLLKAMFLKSQLTGMLLELLILILLALPLTYLITKSFMRPLESLSTDFGEVMNSQFTQPVPPSKVREINPITSIFEKVRLTILSSFEQIRKNEKDLSTTLNSITDGIITIDTSGIVNRLNPIAEKFCGSDTVSAQSKPLSQILPLKAFNKNETPRDIITEILQSKKPLTARAEITLTDEATPRTIDVTSSLILNDRQELQGFVIFMRDITERLLVEEELRQSRKMESLGQLAGGVAHDFNNMLGGIIGFSEILKMGAAKESKEESYINHILEAATNAADLTAKLLAFSRKGKMISTIFDIHSSCEAAVSLLYRTINRNITIETDLKAAESSITGDPSQIQNVILNLCINAKDAMPEGGKIVLKSTDVTLEKANLYNLSPGEYIQITVSDTGHGIPQALITKIFEPFFTTKSVGKGTGLGLAAVYGAIKNHHGDVLVESTEGVGTTFTILLPVIVGAKQRSEDSVSHSDEALESNILIIDDERIIRSMLASIIAELGGTTIQAVDGKDAIAVFQEHHHTLDAVILDMVMPEMNGDVCFYELQKIDPSVPVFVSSGFDKNTSISTLLDDGAAGYLHKPFTIEELTEMLYKIKK